MNARGVTGYALSESTKVPQPTIHRILVGQSADPKTATLKPLADYFGVTLEQLRTELPISMINIIAEQAKLDMRSKSTSVTMLYANANKNIKYDGIRVSPPPRAPVPVISLIKAGAMKTQEYLPDFDEVAKWETPDEKLGARGWAHIVEGDSMDDGTEKGIPEGWLIFVDPDIEPQHNHFVIAKDVTTQATTFKKLIFVDGKWYLKPLNRHYQPKEIDSPELRVIAVVTETRAPSRKLL